MQLIKKFCSLFKFKPVLSFSEQATLSSERLKVSLWFISIKYCHPFGSFDDWLKKEKWEDEMFFRDTGSHVEKPDVKERLNRLNIILDGIKKYPDKVNWRDSGNTVMDYWCWTGVINWKSVLVTKNSKHHSEQT